MFGHKKLFEELLEHRNGVKVHSVNLVDRALLSQQEKVKLSSVGLGSYDVVKFHVNGQTYCNGILNQHTNLEGSLINIQTDTGVEQVIFIPQKVPYENNLEPKYQEEWSSMLQLIALAHELGHASDIQRENSNFKIFPTPSVDLVGAEAYANAYALNYLNSINASTARNTLASIIYKATNSTKVFEKQLYTSICKLIGKGRIKRWAA